MSVVNVTMLCVTLSLLLTLNAAYIHAHQLQPSHELGAESSDYHLDHHGLPRKLMSYRKVEGYEAKGLSSQSEKFKESSGKSQEIEAMVRAAKGTRRHEWIEGSDPSHEYFTMDYGHVKRRRPIHNKSFPKAVTNSP